MCNNNHRINHRVRIKKNDQTMKYYLKNKEFYYSEEVYEPKEDSYLMAENIKFEAKKKVLDMGCGSGIQSMNALIQNCEVIAVDLNPKALEITKQNSKQIKKEKKIKTIQSNLFEKIKKQKFDYILFNPPYVPSDTIKYIELDGGKKGREILNKFLEEVPKWITEKGKIYFIQTNINGIKETKNILKKYKLKMCKKATKKEFFEELYLIQAEKEE